MYQKTLISNAKFRLNREKEKSGQWKREIIGVSFLSDSDHWFQLGYPRNEVALFQILVLMSCFDKVSVLMLHLALQSWLMLRGVLDIEEKKSQFFSYLANDSLTVCQITSGILFLIQLLLVWYVDWSFLLASKELCLWFWILDGIYWSTYQGEWNLVFEPLSGESKEAGPRYLLAWSIIRASSV